MSTRYKNTVIAPSGNFGSLTVSGTQISLQDFTNRDSTFYNVTANSGYWDSTFHNVTANSADWKQTLSYTNSSSELSISNGNTVSLSSLSDSLTVSYDGISGFNITSPLTGQLLVFSPSGEWANRDDRGSLENMYIYARDTFYNELIYTGDLLSRIDVYHDDTKSTQMFQRSFTYTQSGLLTSVITTDLQTGGNGSVLTKQLNYNTTTNTLTSTSRVYS